MRLNQEHVKMFQELSTTQMGRNLIEYCEQIIQEECSISKCTVDNLAAKKELEKAIREHLIDRIKLVNKEKVITNDYI